MKYKQRFEFSTKADTLERLRPLLHSWIIPDSYYFAVSEWRADPERILDAVAKQFKGATLIVRSSSVLEDGAVSAQAGAFLSLPNIDAKDRKIQAQAIDAVIQSFANSSHENVDSKLAAANQILIQEMVTGVNMSGVLFTQDLSTGAPYYVINYDDESGTTDSVTRGDYNNRTLYIFRDAIDKISSHRFKKLIQGVRELEHAVDDDCIDIEFAINRDEELVLFQVRRITTQPNWNRGLYLRIKDAIESVDNGLRDRYAHGDAQGACDVVLGNMPDWNPAEIIGTTPRPLALSLYRYLITDSVWRTARRDMGYKERPGMPLMLSLAGKPYIDVRESFYSYLPVDLPEDVSDKLVHAWLDRLKNNHHLHDKVEFDVATTIYTPDFDDRVRKQFPAALNADELDIYRDRLRHLTNSLLKNGLVRMEQDMALVEFMESRRRTIHARYDKPSLEVVSSLLEDTIRYGTLPFSKLARHGFIASSFLKAIAASGAMTADEISRFQNSVPTVASEFIGDAGRVGNDPASLRAFLDKYGHLRPGTYDILSLRYDERDVSLFQLYDVNGQKENIVFELSKDQRKAIGTLLTAHDIETDVDTLFQYMRRAIQGREYAKFLFTRNLSDSLAVLTYWGARHGLSKDELSYIDIRDILDCMTCISGRTIEEQLRRASEAGRKYHEITTAIKLPFLIYDLSDLYIVPLSVEHPNFITRKNSFGKVIYLKTGNVKPEELDDKIVAIESADPGFDWIFTRPIKGLITKYGGANSHMAIRCAEFNLPSAIGCGEQIFERVVASNHIELKCATGQIIIG